MPQEPTVVGMKAEHLPAEGTRVHQAEPNNGERRLDEMVVASGISLRLWRLYAQAWLVCFGASVL
jgi:hypothetical protein